MFIRRLPAETLRTDKGKTSDAIGSDLGWNASGHNAVVSDTDQFAWPKTAGSRKMHVYPLVVAAVENQQAVAAHG